MLHIIFKCKNLPRFEICRVVYLLLLTAVALTTSGKYVTSIFHCREQVNELTGSINSTHISSYSTTTSIGHNEMYTL